MKKIACLLFLVGVTTSLSATLTVTTTTISSSQNPSMYGQSVTFTATVTSSQGPPPNGETITFLQGGASLGTGTLNGGSAQLTTSSLLGGTDNIKAQYPGDSTFKASNSKALAQQVQLASTTTSLSVTPNAWGGEYGRAAMSNRGSIAPVSARAHVRRAARRAEAHLHPAIAQGADFELGLYEPVPDATCL